MYKVLRSVKDAYITDQVVRGVRAHSANTGKAGTINLFKLYGVTQTDNVDNIELSRGLIKFDLDGLRQLHSSNKIDITDSSFRCFIKLFDVYGGQTTPAEFDLDVCPLAKNFVEGIGKDVLYYKDSDIVNFLTASQLAVWTLSGANSKGTIGDGSADVFVSSSFGSLVKSQHFTDGTEDLYVDVTQIMSATLTNQLQDHGFRISFSESQENDQYTRFIKRFVTKDAHDKTRHPQLIVHYNDSISADNGQLVYDGPNQVILYNKVRNVHTNIMSASTTVSGTNCILATAWISSSNYSLTFTGSQYKNMTGIYFANIEIDSTNSFFSQITNSGKATFTLKWESLDQTVCYSSSSYEISLPDRIDTNVTNKEYFVTGLINSECSKDETVRVRVHIEDIDTPYVKYVKTPYITPSAFPTDVLYSIRNATSNDVVIPFDYTYKSTKLSNDSQTLWFDLDMSSLYVGQQYEIDIVVIENDIKKYYKDVASKFKVIA